MRKGLKAKHLAFIVPGIALLALVGFRFYQAAKSQSETQSGPRGQGGTRVEAVETGFVEVGKLNEKISLVGSLKAKELVDVNPKVAGRIVQMKVDTGHPVRSGALLAVIEDAEIEQQVERSKASMAVNEASISQREAELANAKAELDRQERLLEAGLISRQQFEAVQTRFRVAQSQLELARAQKRQSEAERRELDILHGQTRVYAPMSGIIAKRHVDVGAMVNPSVPIVTVVNVSTMVIYANAPERDVARIKLGLPATVTFDSLPGQRYEGRVMRISPVLDPQTRNGTVEIEIDNRDGALKAEMFARSEVDLGTTREATLIPRDALVYRGEQPGVYLLASGTAKFQAVETGLNQGDRIEVIAGVKEGEVVVTRGANLIKDGDPVKVEGNSPVGQERP